MVKEELTDGDRIATILTAELRNRDSGGYERLAVSDDDDAVVVYQTEPTRRELGRYEPAVGEGLTVTFEDGHTEHIPRAADVKRVADTFIDRLE